MHDSIKVCFQVFSALFPLVDPISSGLIFLALTRNTSPAIRRNLSCRITWYSVALMAGSYFLGPHILAFFGVSLPAVQVGGGIIVCAFGWSLLMEKDGERNAEREVVESQHMVRRAFYPLTLPLTIGPGAISVAVTLGAHSTHNYGFQISLIVAAVTAMGLIALSILLCYRFAGWLGRVLGETGTIVVVRLSAFLLLCIGVQIVWNGIKVLLGSVQFPAH